MADERDSVSSAASHGGREADKGGAESKEEKHQKISELRKSMARKSTARNLQSRLGTFAVEGGILPSVEDMPKGAVVQGSKPFAASCAAISSQGMLPKQLSPALLTVLVDDLIEHNTVTCRQVSLRRFREKYIGLYFGTFADEKCQQFLGVLKAFCTIMNHKFECVLVSCDDDEEAYARNVFDASCPAYPQGDYRAVLLRKHFEIGEVPRLVILDPNGMVTTIDGATHMKGDPMALNFPWTDAVTESLWGENLRGQLVNVLDDLMLPSVNGCEASERDVVGLLFGEPWCPETRDMLRRLEYLKERLDARVGPDGGEVWGEDSFAFYFCHSEDLGKFRNFPDFKMPFETVQVTSPSRLEALFHYFEIKEPPAFRVVAPDKGWLLADGSEWLRRDPAGLLFPWKHFVEEECPDELLEEDEDIEEADKAGNVVHVLDEGTLEVALQNGPVFIAFLHEVHAKRAEAFNGVRFAAEQFVSSRSSGFNGFNEGPVPAMKMANQRVSEFEEESVHSTDEIRESLFARPGESPKKNMGQGFERAAKLGDRVLFDASQRNGLMHGSAPWNFRNESYCAARGEMQFFYTKTEDKATEMLKRFCGHDPRRIRQHSRWQRANQPRGAEAERQLDDLRERFGQVTEALRNLASKDARAATTHPNSMQAKRSFVRPRASEFSAFDDPAKKVLQGLGHEDANNADSLENSRAMPYQPRTRHTKLQEATEEFLGDETSQGQGSAVIIDMCKGAYHVCSNLLDGDLLLRFLTAWQEDAIDALDISLPNGDEVVRDEDQEEATRQLVASAEAKLGVDSWIDQMPNPMPGIVIWFPSKQHAECGERPSALFRALLHHAYRRCPKQDGGEGWIDPRSRPIVEDLGDLGGHGDMLTPWIEKMWIFGLLQGEEGDEEEEDVKYGRWESAGDSFLKDLYDYVEVIVKKAASEDFRLEKMFAAGGQSDGGKQSAGAGRGGKGSSLHFEEKPESQFETHAKNYSESHMRLRQERPEELHTIPGNLNITMRTAGTRKDLYDLFLDELCHHALLQSPPPPLFILLAGDMPPFGTVPLPSFLRPVHMNVLGSVQDLERHRELCPLLLVQDWERWVSNSLDPHIPPQVSKHFGVPWQ